MSLNIFLTSVALGCVFAVLAQTVLPLDGEFLVTAVIASFVLLAFAVKIPRWHRPVRGKD